MEDEVPFDNYCQSMGEDGTWAGHIELQAASLVTHRNICIHRVCYVSMVQNIKILLLISSMSALCAQFYGTLC